MSSELSISNRAWSLIGLLALIWGASFVAVRVALDEIGPMTVIAHRTFWAMLVLWAVVGLRRLPLRLSGRHFLGFIGMGLLNNVIPFGLMAWGQLHVASGLTSILNATTAIFGVLVAALFLADERLNLRKLVGVVLGFLGVATAMGLQNLAAFDVTSLAQLAILLGTLSYALAGVWARRYLSDLSPQVAAAGMLTGASLVTVPLAWWIEGPVSLALEGDTLLAIGYFAIIATAGAYLLYYRVLALAGSGNLLLVTLLIPPVAITLGALLRDEALGAHAFAGLGILVLGLLIIDGRAVGALTFRRGA